MKVYAVDVEGNELLGKLTMVVGAETNEEARLAALVAYEQRVREAQDDDADADD